MNKKLLILTLFVSLKFHAFTQRIVIYFNGTPSTTPSVSKAKMRYNKDFAYSLTFDDGNIDAYNCALPIFEGGNALCGFTSGKGLFFTDGCGNFIPFKAGLALNSASAFGLDTHDGSVKSQLTWTQIDALYEKGWDIFNHSFSHKSRFTNTMSAKDYVDEINLNTAEIRNKTKNKVETPIFVVPSSDGLYQDVAYNQGSQLVFDQSANSIGIGGMSVNNDLPNNRPVIHRQIVEEVLNTGRDIIGSAAAKSALGESTWYNEFTHNIDGATGLDFNRFRSHVERIAGTFGSGGNDRMWMASLQEVYEYLLVRQKVTYTATVNGNQLILDFDTSQLPSWMRRKPLTLLINSNNSFNKVDAPTGAKMSFNGQSAQKLINIDFAGASTVTVNPCDSDTTPPTFANCPVDIFLTTSDSSAQANWNAPTASDNCTTPSLSSTYISGSTFPLGSTTVVYTALDAKKNKATCSFNVKISPIVVVTNPTNVCAPKGTSPWSLWISNVKISDLNNTSESFKNLSSLGFSDYSNLTATVTKGETYPLSISNNLSWNGNIPSIFCRVWIDFNKNNLFENNELVLEKNNAKVLITNVLVPTTAATGLVRMRVATKWGSYPTACETFEKGEVEDYTVNIILPKLPTVTTKNIALNVNATPSVYVQWTAGNFTISAKNNLNKPLNDVKIEFPFPAKINNGGGVVPSVGTWEEYCVGNVKCYIWTIPTFAANATATLEVPIFVADAVAPIVATARLLNDSSKISASFTINPAPVKTALSRRNPTQFIPIVLESIEPNLTDGDVFVNIESIIEKTVRFDFYNVLGKSVKSEYRKIQVGNNRLYFDFFDLEDGVYFIQTGEGIGRDAPLKFVKF